MKLYIKSLTVGVAMCLGVMVASADECDEIVNRALKYNPEVMALQSSVVTKSLESRVDNNLGDTEIEVGQEWGNLGAGNKFNVSVTQGFDWPGLYRARRLSNRALDVAGEASVLSMQADLAVEVKSLLIDIAACQLTNRLRRQVADGLDLMLAGAEKQYAQSTITILDLNKIRIEAANADLALAEGEDMLVELMGQLSALCGGEEAIELNFNSFPYESLVLSDLEHYLDKALSDYNPVRRSVIATRDHAIAAERVAALERAPGFSLGYDYEREAGVTFHGFHVGVTLPVFSSRGKVAAARAAIAETVISIDNLDAEIRRNVSRDYKLAQSLKRQIDAYGPAIAVNDNLKLLKSAFDRGVLELSHFLSDVNYFLEAEQRYIDLKRRYYRQLVSLDRYN